MADNPEAFVVVSKVNKDDNEYASAVVFNRTDKDADNEETANDFLAERKTLAPWNSHAVVSLSDFQDTYPDPANAPAPSDPKPVNA